MIRACSLAFALLLPVIAACGGDDPPRPVTPAATATRDAETAVPATATAEPTSTVVPTARPRPEANPFPADLRAGAEALLAQIAEARGVEEAQPVDMFLLTREQARAFYDDGVDETPDEAPGLDPRQELYELLGLVPERADGSAEPDVDEQELENLISIITGFYEPAYRAFYMIETINGGIYGSLARSTIVHELTHALQYQEARIDRIGRERSGNFDATTALLSVIEGDAVNTEIEVLGFSTRSTLRETVCFRIPASRNDGTPYAVERELDVWYEDGLCFIQAILEQDPDGIARIFGELPQTMEQILHPQKYLAGEPARPVSLDSLAAALGGAWRELGNGVFGEFGLQNVLLTGLPEDRTRVQDAAAGWGGDAWKLYASGDSRLLHLGTAWDTPDDASQFLDAVVACLDNRGFSAAPGGPATTLSLDGTAWALDLRGDRVTVLVANDAAALDSARDTLAAP